jgi:hypothetical protein
MKAVVIKMVKFFLQPPTFVSVLALPFIIFGVPRALYSLPRGGGESMGGTIILLMVFAISGLFLLDRLIVFFFSPFNLNKLVLNVICSIFLSSFEIFVLVGLSKNLDFDLVSMIISVLGF